MKLLFTVSNKYYIDKNIEIFSFIRFIIMCFLSLYNNAGMLSILPPMNMTYKGFYQSLKLIIIKLSSYSLISWIMLDGAVVAYKFLSYIKANTIMSGQKTNVITFTKAFSFCFTFIPKILIYLYIYYLFYFCFDKFYTITTHSSFVNSFYFNYTLIYKYLSEMYIKKKKYFNTWDGVVPLALEIKSGAFTDYTKFGDEFNFMYIITNEFLYCLLLILFLYLCFNVKSHLLEKTVLCCIGVFIFILHFVFYYSANTEGESLNLYYILGEQFSELGSALSFSYYFMGAILGICFFYFNDSSESGKFLLETTIHKPFEFLLNIVSFFSQHNILARSLLTVFSVCILLLTLPEVIALKYSSMDLPEMNTFLFVCFFFEKILFGVLFMGITLMLISLSKDQSINFTRFGVFSCLDRISFVFFAMLEWVILVSYSIFQFQVSLNYVNVIGISLGTFVITFGMSVVIHVCVELPIRKIVKRIGRDKDWLDENGDRCKKDYLSEKNTRKVSEEYEEEKLF